MRESIATVSMEVSTRSFSTLDECEKSCVAEPSGGICSIDIFWWIEVFLPKFVISALISQVLGMCLVARVVAPRQQFSTGLLSCCAGRWCGRWCGKDKCRDCWFVTCCPCLQRLRVTVFVRGGCFGCCVVLLSICCAPCALVLYTLCSSCCGTWLRYHLRQRLEIKGKCWQDCLIHALLSPCALCQEATELRKAGFGPRDGTLFLYEHEPQIPMAPVSPPAAHGNSEQDQSSLKESLLPLIPEPERPSQALQPPPSAPSRMPVMHDVAEPSVWTVEDHQQAVTRARMAAKDEAAGMVHEADDGIQ